MIKVLWISNIPSPYKIELMNMLGRKVDLTSYFEYAKANDRDDKWYGKEFDNFRYKYLENKWFVEILKLFSSDYDVLINSDYSSIICILATIIFRIKGKKVVLQADGGIPVNRGIIMNKMISMVMKLSNAYLSSGYETDKYFNYYGINKNIMHYRFSSLNKIDIDNNKKYYENKCELKNKYNLNNKKVFLSVGQPIHRKGFDILIKAYDKIKTDNTILLIVGGKLQEDNLKLIDELKIDSIKNIEFLVKEDLSIVYGLSDYFVLATREDIWGLVINEAMSFGLPIISTNRCVAAVEFNKICNNAKIVEVEDIDGLANSMQKLLTDDNYAKILGGRSIAGIKDFVIENTAKDYYNAIKEINK